MTDIVKQLRAQSAYLVEFRADGPLEPGNVGSDVAPLWQRAADEIERLSGVISDVTKWRPIDGAPKDKNILLADGKRVSEGGWISALDQGADYEHQAGFTEDWWSVAGIESPTHWMPIPEAPK